MADVKKPKNSKWQCSCASALCTNTFRTEGITYYTLPSDPELQKGYAELPMNENVNWRKHVICSAHWSTGKREDKHQLPDVICSQEYAVKLNEDYLKNPRSELKRKEEISSQILPFSTVLSLNW